MITLDVTELELVGDAAAEGWLLGHARMALEEIARREKVGGEVRVRLVRDDEMAALHKRTLGLDETTDVLTFDLLEGEDEAARKGRIDADIVVCADEAARQARGLGHNTEHEALLYIVHGVLHCVPGYDDLEEGAAERMHQAEDEILRAIGVGAIYRKG